MLLMLCASIRGTAQDVDGVTGATKQHADTTVASKALNALSHLHLGGYGEAVMTRNFYSQRKTR